MEGGREGEGGEGGVGTWLRVHVHGGDGGERRGRWRERLPYWLEFLKFSCVYILAKCCTNYIYM